MSQSVASLPVMNLNILVIWLVYDRVWFRSKTHHGSIENLIRVCWNLFFIFIYSIFETCLKDGRFGLWICWISTCGIFHWSTMEKKKKWLILTKPNHWILRTNFDWFNWNFSSLNHVPSSQNRIKLTDEALTGMAKNSRKIQSGSTHLQMNSTKSFDILCKLSIGAFPLKLAYL